MIKIVFVPWEYFHAASGYFWSTERLMKSADKNRLTVILDFRFLKKFSAKWFFWRANKPQLVQKMGSGLELGMDASYAAVIGVPGCALRHLAILT